MTMLLRCIFAVPLLTVFALDEKRFNLNGYTSPEWGNVRYLFYENFVQQNDLGASIAIYHQGKLVVDLQAGWFDETRSKPYNNNTLQIVFSATKGLVAAAVAVCVQNGWLDYSSLVTKYWPEYGQYGKENTTVADVLSHRAGLPNDPTPSELMLNWTAIIHSLEQQTPEWPPGTAHGYHGLTYGFLAGELVQRVDPQKRTFSKFIHDEITSRLNIEFYIGLPKEQEYRVSPLYFNSETRNILNDESLSQFIRFNDQQYHQAEIPGVNGITTAASLAKLYASLIGDLDHGNQQRLLTEQILNRAINSSTPENEVDMVRGIANQFAMGFQIFDDQLKSLGSRVFGHEGAGGSVGFAAPDKNLSFAYVVNQYTVNKNVREINVRMRKIVQHIGTVIGSKHYH